MSQSKKSSKHKRSISYSGGGILSSFLNQTHESKHDKLAALDCSTTSKTAPANHRLLVLRDSLAPPDSTKAETPGPISPVDGVARSGHFHFTFGSQTTQEIADRLQGIEQGLSAVVITYVCS